MKKLTKAQLGVLRYFLDCGFTFNRYYYPDGRHEKGIAKAKEVYRALGGDWPDEEDDER